MKKVQVNGLNAHPLWKHAKIAFPGEIRWNFEGMFLFDNAGKPVGRFSVHDMPALTATLERLLES